MEDLYGLSLDRTNNVSIIVEVLLDILLMLLMVVVIVFIISFQHFCYG
jgi:hypothetical protein